MTNKDNNTVSEVKVYTTTEIHKEYQDNWPSAPDSKYVSLSTYITLKAESDKLKTAIQQAMNIKELWQCVNSYKPEHENEAIALNNMYNGFVSALTSYKHNQEGGEGNG